MNRDPRDCVYRRRSRWEEEREFADCLLLETVTGIDGSLHFGVRRDACESCCDHFPPTPEHLNPVVASLLYGVASRVIAVGGMSGCDVSKAAELQAIAERNLSWRRVPPPGAVACDVILCCAESSSHVDQAVDSALSQRNAQTFLHLVDDGGGGSEVVNRHAGRGHVFTYANPIRQGTFRTLHTLLPRLRSSYVAIQDPGTASTPNRIWHSVGMLESDGGEFLAAPVETPDGLIRPERPRPAYRRYLPPQTLVCRRASLVDMGGIAERAGDADAELIFRAFQEARKILLFEEPTAVAVGSLDLGELGEPPQYEDRKGTLRHHAMGFPQETVECDVVLPFHGHLDFVEESLPSVIDQEGAETVVHLVDDATPGGAEKLFRSWGSHPRVRIYRNERNLGQFVSFNNVFPYLETNLVAIQDADDISLPHRIRLAGNHLRLADADIFGGRFEIFESGGNRRSPTAAGELVRHPNLAQPPYWASSYPRKYERLHFLQNPTAVIRKGAFESLRGFSDYGDVARNKCGLDTEFYVRCALRGVPVRRLA